MYSLYSKQLSKPVTNNVTNIPFQELTAKYSLMFSAAFSEYNRRLQLVRQRQIEEYNSNHLANNEAPYEGDYEHLPDPKSIVGEFPGLSSADAKKFSEFVENFATEHRFLANAEWIFSQLLAKFAELPLKKNTSGKYSGSALLAEIRKDPWLSGALLLTRQDSKGKFIKKQTDPAVRNFTALVPFVMSAFKKYQNIPYSAWDPEEVKHITHPALVNAMTWKTLPEILAEEVISDRTEALTPKTGARAGIMSNPATTYTLYIRSTSKLHGLPTLLQIMMCQTWCAHPSNRTEYMILNPLDWDNMPEPLIESNPLAFDNTQIYNPSYSNVW